MYIYQSTKVLSYVYLLTHRITGQIYIGSRYSKKQKLPSNLDLPLYKTSSKIVKPIFDEFDWIIIAEFFDRISAVKFEQELIFENKNNPLILNRHICLPDGSKKFICPEFLTDETKKKMSKASKGKSKSEEHIGNIRKCRIGWIVSEETKLKIGNANRGRKFPPNSEEYLELCRSKKWWNNGIINKFQKDQPSGFEKGRVKTEILS